ncbi:MAG: hypothetical protein IPG59_00110 [Candidatus Melainabacteria bacterium]|nr:MAG: hypothetical protein IPG59_00110 [Candidatus Melainabacteria bacterium]
MRDIKQTMTEAKKMSYIKPGYQRHLAVAIALVSLLTCSLTANAQYGSEGGDRGRQSQSTGTQTQHAAPLTAGPRGLGNNGGPYQREDNRNTGNGNSNNQRNGQTNNASGGGGGGGGGGAPPGCSGTGIACVAAQAAFSMGEMCIDPSMAGPSGGRSKEQRGPEKSGTQASLFGALKDMSCDDALGPAARPGKAGPKACQTGKDILKRLNQKVGRGMTPEAAKSQAAMMAGLGRMYGERPHQQRQQGQAQGAGQSAGAANTAAEIGHEQADSAITYVGSYLRNFTSDAGNKWNQVRDKIFVPIGILLLLPGALITQMRAIMATSNPVLGNVNPLDGIFRSMVAVFLLPTTYLVMNYGIDLANSLTLSVADNYQQIFGSDMYEDAVCAEIKAMPFRLPEENRNTIDMPKSSMGEILVAKAPTPFAKLEAALVAVKIWDPCVGIYIVPPDRADEVVPTAVHAARLMCNTSNCSLVTAWNILCAFQVAFLYYLWCVGPVVAGLWTWPMKQLRDALPNWIEGVITLCFWSLFWNTVVFLMAAFRGVDETGTLIMLALNSLACLSVKYAFDFSGLARGAGQQIQKLSDKFANTMHQEAKKAGKGGGGGGGGGGKGKKGGSNPSGPAAPAAPAAPTVNSGGVDPEAPAPVPADNSARLGTDAEINNDMDINSRVEVVPGRTGVATDSEARVSTGYNGVDFKNGFYSTLTRSGETGEEFQARMNANTPEGQTLRDSVKQRYIDQANAGRKSATDLRQGLTSEDDRKRFDQLVASGAGGVEHNMKAIMARVAAGKETAVDKAYLTHLRNGMSAPDRQKFDDGFKAIETKKATLAQAGTADEKARIQTEINAAALAVARQTGSVATLTGGNGLTAHLRGGASQVLARDAALPPLAAATVTRDSYKAEARASGLTEQQINARMAAMEEARKAGLKEFPNPDNPTGPKLKVETFRDALPPTSDPVAIERAARIEAARLANASTYIDPVTNQPVSTPPRERVAGEDPAIAQQRIQLIAAARAANQATYVDPVTKQPVPVPPVRNREIVERTVMAQSPAQQSRITTAKSRGEDYYREWIAKERERLRAEARQIGESGYLDPETNQWVALNRNRGGGEFDTAMITAADIDPMTGQPIVHRPGEVVQGIQPMLRGEISRSARKAGDDLDIIATPEGEDIEERLRKQKGKPDDTMLTTNDFSQPNQFGRASVEGDPQMIVPAEGVAQPDQAQLRPDQLDAEGRMADGQPGQPQQIDPQTGLPIDPKTGLPIDPRNNLPFNPQTGQYFDPRTGLPIHPNQAYQMGLQAGGGMLLSEQDRARQQQQRSTTWSTTARTTWTSTTRSAWTIRTDWTVWTTRTNWTTSR